jgi:hypothetical protein
MQASRYELARQGMVELANQASDRTREPMHIRLRFNTIRGTLLLYDT